MSKSSPWEQVKAAALTLAEAALVAVKYEIEARRAASETPGPAPAPEPDEAEQLALELALDVADVRAVLDISDAQIVRAVAHEWSLRPDPRRCVDRMVEQHSWGPFRYDIRQHPDGAWRVITPRGEINMPFRTSLAALNAAWSLYAKDIEEQEGENNT